MEAIKTRGLFGRKETARRLLTRLQRGKPDTGGNQALGCFTLVAGGPFRGRDVRERDVRMPVLCTNGFYWIAGRGYDRDVVA